MIEQQDYQYLQDRFDERYKKLSDCVDDMKHAEDEHHLLDKRLSVIETQQKVNNWLTAAIAGGIIALVIKVFIGG